MLRIVRSYLTPQKKKNANNNKENVDSKEIDEKKDEFELPDKLTKTEPVKVTRVKAPAVKIVKEARITRAMAVKAVAPKQTPSLTKFFKDPVTTITINELEVVEESEVVPVSRQTSTIKLITETKSIEDIKSIKEVKSVKVNGTKATKSVKEKSIEDTKSVKEVKSAKVNETKSTNSVLKTKPTESIKENKLVNVNETKSSTPRMSLRSRTLEVLSTYDDSAMNSPTKPKKSISSKSDSKTDESKSLAKASAKVYSEKGGYEDFDIEITEDEDDENISEAEEESYENEEEGHIVQSKKRPAKRRNTRSTAIKKKKKSKKSDPRWDRISETFKAGGTIEALPGRVDEFDWIKRTVTGLLESSLGGCLYISGVPGTGKTATTYRTLDALGLAWLNGKCREFDFVEINGMRLSDPGQAYSILAKTIFRGDKKLSHAAALQKLEAHFKVQQKSKTPGKPCIVLLDELDLLLRKKQSILYHFFEWPNWTNSQLIVITIANTMDLPERFLSNRISSRLGLTRYNFKPYDHAALANIIEHQLKDYVQFLGKDAIQLCARKVSAVSGDARRAVNLAKRAVDYFRSSSQEELMTRVTGRVVDKVASGSEMTNVNLRLMDLILKDALMANPVEVIGQLAKHQRILLLSIVLGRKRLEEEMVMRGGTRIIGGVNGSKSNGLTVNKLLDQHFQLCRTHQYHPLPSLQELHFLLESLEALRLIRCVKFREMGPEAGVQLLVHEEDVRKGLGDDAALKKYIREQ